MARHGHVMRGLVAAALLGSAAPIALAAAGDPPASDVHWHVAPFPVGSYGSDVGLTLGAALFAYRHTRALGPMRDDMLSLRVDIATRGPREVVLSGSIVRPFGVPLLTRWDVALADDPTLPYWGEGAQLGGLPVPTGYGTPPEPYRYHGRRAFVAGLIRGPLGGPFAWHLRGRWLDLDIRSRGALLQASNPPGAAGGRVLLGEIGLMLDTRDNEVAPHRGVLLEASAFSSPRLGSVSHYSFHGYTFGARAYAPLLPRITLAVRALYDRKLAGPGLGSGSGGTAVPFFERSLYEGFNYGEGLGGGSTVRGVARFRLSGEEKILGNAELRAVLFRSHLLGNTQDWGMDVGLDAGRAQQHGYAPVHAESAVAGLRLVWGSSVVVRVQAGRVRGGETAVYLSFGELF